MSNRTYDMKSERIITDFLKARLYPEICSEQPKWFENKEDQLKGKDCILSFDDQKNKKVDIKCAHDYVVTDISKESLPTFAFELSFCKNQEEIQGWLYDTSKETEYYLVSWLWANVKKGFKVDDILKFEGYLIQRQELIKYLYLNNLRPGNASEINKKIRECGIDGKHELSEFQEYGLSGSFYFYYSKNRKSEGPINIIIRKDELSKLATKKFTLSL